MCRHPLQHLAGGSFPVARYSAAARNNKRQVRRCIPLSLALGIVRSTRAPPATTGRPIGGDRGPRTLMVLGDSHGTIRKPGDGRLQTPLAAGRRPRETSPPRISSLFDRNDQDVATAGCDAPFPGSHGRIGPYDRGYRLGSPWVGIMAPKRPVRSDAMMGC